MSNLSRKDSFRAARKTCMGFSLIELAIVVGVLAILGAVAIPAFGCIVRKSRVSAAYTALLQIQRECVSRKTLGEEEVFSESNLPGYFIDSDGKSCKGKLSSGLVAAIPDNSKSYPSLLLNLATGSVSYNLNGKEGVDIGYCLKLLCTPPEVHDPSLDPIHGDACTKFRTSWWTQQPFRLMTGCYGDAGNPKAVNANGWIPDPCASTPEGCQSRSFRTNYGWYPCVSDGKTYKIKVPNGFPETMAQSCDSSNPGTPPPPPKVFCWPPKEDCK